MILTPTEMIAAERAAFAAGTTAEALMDQAARGIAAAVHEFHSGPGRCLVFYGRGGNGGDALAAAVLLKAAGWLIEECPANPDAALEGLPAKYRVALRVASGAASETQPLPPGHPLVILDGLLGIGARGSPRAATAEAIRRINALREGSGAWVLALDGPSGLDLEGGHPAETCVRADATVAIGCVKTGMVADTATDFVGRLLRVPLSGVTPVGEDEAVPAFAGDLSGILPPRAFDLHKGRCGRVGIVAGSPGFTGAARLCALGALRAGAGLVTLFVEPSLADVLAAACPPEVMVRGIRDLRKLIHEPLDSLAVGPGAGFARRDALLALIRDQECPVVVDADAITVLASDPALLRHCRGPRLLTPHPGEMERLEPRKGRDRRAWALDFARSFGVTVLLKGARTVLAAPGVPVFFNVSGNPGMATGGMGDVLTGVCAALLAQRPDASLLTRAALGSWLCGRAAECALRGGQSPESLLASDVAHGLGAAFRDLRRDFPSEPVWI